MICDFEMGDREENLDEKSTQTFSYCSYNDMFPIKFLLINTADSPIKTSHYFQLLSFPEQLMAINPKCNQ